MAESEDQKHETQETVKKTFRQRIGGGLKSAVEFVNQANEKRNESIRLKKENKEKEKEENKDKSIKPPRKGIKGIIKGLFEGIKNVAFGLAALPAHIVTNPLDVIGKAAIVLGSSIPVLGAIVTFAYVAQQSARKTGPNFGSVLKGFVAGVAALAPGVGPIITGIYATKNVGEQIQKEVKPLGAIRNKYLKAGERINNFGKGAKKIIDFVKKPFRAKNNQQGKINDEIRQLPEDKQIPQTEQVIQQEGRQRSNSAPLPSKAAEVEKTFNQVRGSLSNRSASHGTRPRTNSKTHTKTRNSTSKGTGPGRG